MTLTPLANAFGWTLLHSLWEGAALALMLAVALLVLQSSRMRYAAACVAMMGMLVGFVVTLADELPQHAAVPSGIPHLPETPDDRRPISGYVARLGAADVPPYLAALWTVGVLLFHLRSTAGWIAARRLRHRGVCVAPDHWQSRLAELRKNLQISRTVNLLESCITGVPLVIGYFRPLILVPVGMLVAMPPGQIESILLHELAHIQRRDYLINLMQTIVENFLFYHPAVWWVSGVIRSEREHCCDDLVLATRGNAEEYAMALTVLEHNRQTANDAVLAANGGNLMTRVTRILYPLEPRQRALAPVILTGVLTLMAAVALGGWQSKPLEPDTASYTKWIDEDVVYIVDAQERTAFKNLGTDAERDRFIAQFWDRRDPTPGTERNEFREEHYRRIGYSNTHFRTEAGQAGWKTDRGRIYIAYGPPDELESHPSGGSLGAPYEEWLYYKITGVGERVIIQFVDKAGNGDYRMTRDPNA